MAATTTDSPAAAQQAQPSQRWDKGQGFVLQPDEGESYWQPKPANGYVIFKVTPRNCHSNTIAVVMQVVAPESFVREHSHDRHDEILFCFEGRGSVVMDGVPHDFVPGTTVFCGRWVKHKIINTGDQPLKFTGTILPPQFDNFFEEIGRPRRPGEATPEPFDRPADVLAIEGRTGFSKT